MMWMFTVGVFGCVFVNETDCLCRSLFTWCSGYEYHMHHVLCDKAWWWLAGLWSVQGQTERKSQEGCVFNPRILPWKAKLLQRALRFLQNLLRFVSRARKETACLLIKKDYCWKLIIVSFYLSLEWNGFLKHVAQPKTHKSIG